MKKTDKLKLVFDFIADYISEEEQTTIKVKKPKKKKKKKVKKPTSNKPTTKELINEGNLVTKSEDNLSRAYQIIKRLDEAKSRGEILGRDNICEALKTRAQKETRKFDLNSFKTIDDDIKEFQEDFSKKNSDMLKKLLSKSKGLEERLIKKETTEKREADERLGVTIDEHGKVVEVKVKPLTEERGEIESHINKIIESETKKEN